MSEWISVKDRLPDHRSTVVILMEKREKYDYVNIVLYDAHKKAFLWQDGSEIKGVEYWRHNDLKRQDMTKEELEKVKFKSTGHIAFTDEHQCLYSNEQYGFNLAIVTRMNRDGMEAGRSRRKKGE